MRQILWTIFGETVKTIENWDVSVTQQWCLRKNTFIFDANLNEEKRTYPQISHQCIKIDGLT